MAPAETISRFEAELRCPKDPGPHGGWCFLLIPKPASDTLPRRGRTTIQGTIRGHPFQATLEPDGQLSHWLRVDQSLCLSAGMNAGDRVTVEMAPVVPEPEPMVPEDLAEVLFNSPAAMSVWNSTTTIARVDWIHWITSAKQIKTRQKRVLTAVDMLASGKKRVCCFDQSGYYSKAFQAPEAAN
ncbi:MAG: YdeI/OmpD-associated family protein [Verrucomicrobia bacterium]|nr:YdeI/OmpD-associated family protein [Verrucomicrobiota bacterium]